MDYKTFISSMTAGEHIFVVTESTSYEDFLSNMSLGKAFYFSDGSFYSVLLTAETTDTQITYTYYTPDGKFTQRVISR